VGKLFRNTWNNTLIVAGNFGRDSAIEVVNQQHADAVAFGRLFISNPDLINRLKENLPLSPYNRSTFYQGNEQGYIDYPEFYKKDLQ
jgi:N-ethylmaleimide reductase